MKINANTVLLDLVVSLRTEMPCLLVLIFLTLMESLPIDVTCVKLEDIYWNSSSPMFRIDNTDHIIDVNKNNEPYEYDQVNLICPSYPPGTHEDDAEKYIIYNVSKDEYDMCTITGPNPRTIAICDEPHRLMFFTITFRPFTPQPGGLEFRPGQDYYFISTSSKENLYNRIGGRCLTNNMRVIFKVCCNQSVKSSTLWTTSTTSTTTSTTTTTTMIPSISVGPGFIRPRTQGPLMPNTPRPTQSSGRHPPPAGSIPTPPDPKTFPGIGGRGGTGSSSETTRGKSGKGENKGEKGKHPNETGMTNDELVRGASSGLSHVPHQRWTTGLVTLLTTVVMVLLAR